jgi:hypothetical protein
MNPRIPLSFFVPFILLGVLALLDCGGISSEKLAGLGEDMGVLEGSVHFVGVPCPLDQPQRPPCDGPYPDYEVVVHDNRGESVVARTRTDDHGIYHVELKAGDYVILTPQGLGDKLESNRFTIVAGKIRVLNLIVDTGVRPAESVPAPGKHSARA